MLFFIFTAHFVHVPRPYDTAETTQPMWHLQVLRQTAGQAFAAHGNVQVFAALRQKPRGKINKKGSSNHHIGLYRFKTHI